MNQAAAVVETIKAVSEAIREAGEIPSGHLYALLCGFMSFSDYEAIISLLKRAGLIKENALNLLIWTGPTISKEATK